MVEGGAMRGAYAAGVVAGLLRAGERFDAIYAASSGACATAYLVAGQHRSLRIWEEIPRRLIRPANALRGAPILDFDHLFGDVCGERIPLDLDAVRRAPAPLYVPLTDAATLAVEYRDLRREKDPVAVLRAAAALPLAYGRPEVVEGRAYFDGGMSDPIPVLRAIADGASDVTVVRTRPLGYRRAPNPAWLCRLAARPYPAASEVFARFHERYNAALDVVARPPAGVTIRAIAPPRRLRLHQFMRSVRGIRRAIGQGLKDARQVSAAPQPSPRSRRAL